MMRVAIDAGHGGIDPGVTAIDNIYEKDIALKLALMVEEKLRGNRLKLYLTRINDSTVFLDQRIKNINSFKADCFVSIHTSFSFSFNSQGITTYCGALGGEGEKLARLVHQGLLAKTLRPDRGIKIGDIYLLREMQIPGCQVEICHLNNEEERLLLLDDMFLEKAAQAISEAILEYLDIGSEEIELDMSGI